ncbi:MAG: hypothetical protein AAF389_04775 [Gemmatimonadota bacterium]
MKRSMLWLAGTAGAVATFAALVPAQVAAQERQLGTIDFPNSGAPEAQADFIEGVLLLHSFEFADAARAFIRAQEVDPDFALAFWGEAMTYNHPLWREQDREAALDALDRYAPTAADRQAKAPTEREAAYLGTLDVLYGEGAKADRDMAYMGAMGRLSAAYPNDHEARSFHSLSILGSTDGERDFATYMRAAAVAQPVFDANPNHPGAVHYIIHSFDDPIHAPLGLKAARAYSGIAPDAGHAQHMTSHIFVAMGMWDDVVDANIRARDVQNAGNIARGGRANVCGHYTSWLHYGWLMQGDLTGAEQGMADCQDRISSGTASQSEMGYYVNMRARHVLDTEDWSAATRWSTSVDDRPGYDFITAYAALQLGERAAAADAAARIDEADQRPRVQILRLQLDALMALDDGDADLAIALLTEATQIEESLPFEFGPPASLKPPHELLGEVAMQVGDHHRAITAFERSLSFTPERTHSLAGLVSAARALDRTAVADDAQARLDDIRSGGHD